MTMRGCGINFTLCCVSYFIIFVFAFFTKIRTANVKVHKFSAKKMRRCKLTCAERQAASTPDGKYSSA